MFYELPSADTLEATTLLNVPASRFTHSVRSAAAYLPAGQTAQDPWPELAAVPASHTAHLLLPFLALVPAGHKEQSLLRATEARPAEQLLH